MNQGLRTRFGFVKAKLKHVKLKVLESNTYNRSEKADKIATRFQISMTQNHLGNRTPTVWFSWRKFKTTKWQLIIVSSPHFYWALFSVH